MTDLVERLLAAIERVEKRARNTSNLVETFMTAVMSPDDVLRLCQAHREIIDTLQAGMPDDLVMDGFEHEGWLQATRVVIKKLAGGYGIQKENSDERA